MPSNPGDKGQPRAYEICVEGRLGDDWADWFGGMKVAWDEQGHTLLTGFIADQAALYGLLAKLRDLGLPLVSVRPVVGRDG
jgi:hypothetical protein